MPNKFTIGLFAMLMIAAFLGLFSLFTMGTRGSDNHDIVVPEGETLLIENRTFLLAS